MGCVKTAEHWDCFGASTATVILDANKYTFNFLVIVAELQKINDSPRVYSKEETKGFIHLSPTIYGGGGAMWHS